MTSQIYTLMQDNTNNFKRSESDKDFSQSTGGSNSPRQLQRGDTIDYKSLLGGNSNTTVNTRDAKEQAPKSNQQIASQGGEIDDQFLNQLQSLISSNQQFGTQLLKLLINKDTPEALSKENGSIDGNIKNIVSAVSSSASTSLTNNSIGKVSVEKVETKSKKKKSLKRSDLLKKMLGDKSSKKNSSSISDSAPFTHGLLQHGSLLKKAPSPLLPNNNKTFVHESVPSTPLPWQKIMPNPAWDNSLINPSTNNGIGSRSSSNSSNSIDIAMQAQQASHTLRNNSSTGSSLKKIKVGNDEPLSPSAVVNSLNSPQHDQHAVSNGSYTLERKTANTYDHKTKSDSRQPAQTDSVPLYHSTNINNTEVLKKEETKSGAQVLSKEELLLFRRKKNTEASARFRKNKKLKYIENLKKYDRIMNEIQNLENRINDLTDENSFWKQQLKTYYELQNKQYLESIKSNI